MRGRSTALTAIINLMWAEVVFAGPLKFTREKGGGIINSTPQS